MSATIDNRRLNIAPMMDYSDRHFRYLMRLLSKNAVLYTEMINCNALLQGDRKRFLQYNVEEHPLSIQLGGNQPRQFAACAQLAKDEGYDEVNLNIGCPSDRVQNGQFGACLMANPELVADCISNIVARGSIPVSVKTRIGIDDQDDYDFLASFISTVSAAGCNTFIIHARKAILTGLSPKQNREIPPLHYDRVRRVKQDFPDLNIVINGGLTEIDHVKQQLQHVDGVMIGRAAYQNTYFIAECEQQLFQPQCKLPTREAIAYEYKDYMQKQISTGAPLRSMSRHLIGLFQGQPGARLFRRKLSEGHLQEQKPYSLKVLDDALSAVSGVR